MVFLPEGCDYIAESKEESLSEAESMSGPLVGKYRDLARKHRVWLSLGGIHIKVSNQLRASSTSSAVVFSSSPVPFMLAVPYHCHLLS